MFDDTPLNWGLPSAVTQRPGTIPINQDNLQAGSRNLPKVPEGKKRVWRPLLQQLFYLLLLLREKAGQPDNRVAGLQGIKFRVLSLHIIPWDEERNPLVWHVAVIQVVLLKPCLGSVGAELDTPSLHRKHLRIPGHLVHRLESHAFATYSAGSLV